MVPEKLYIVYDEKAGFASPTTRTFLSLDFIPADMADKKIAIYELKKTGAVKIKKEINVEFDKKEK